MEEATAKLSMWFEKWNALPVKANLSGAAALEAVKQDGYALRYVKWA